MDRSEPEIVMEDMTEGDLDRVLEIERVSYPTPWSRDAFLHDLLRNPFGWNVVVRESGRVIAYACLWIVDAELKINNIAVAPERRGERIGRHLLEAILDESIRRGCSTATLEVRPSNRRARALYASLGFVETGRRKDYYQDTHEDGILLELALSPSSSRCHRDGPGL